jgi:hypothetical protein
VPHSADDFLLGWAPDGKSIFFGCDRTATIGKSGYRTWQKEVTTPSSWPPRIYSCVAAKESFAATQFILPSHVVCRVPNSDKKSLNIRTNYRRCTVPNTPDHRSESVRKLTESLENRI